MLQCISWPQKPSPVSSCHVELPAGIKAFELNSLQVILDMPPVSSFINLCNWKMQ